MLTGKEIIRIVKESRKRLRKKVKLGEPETSFPTSLDIELSSACNLKCPMCPRSKPGFAKSRKIGHMSDRVFGHIYEQLMAHHGMCRWIWLHVGGESLLDPKFVERTNLLKETGAWTAVSTNVTPLTRKLTRRILRSRLGRLILCVDGATKETYEAIRVGADFDDVTAKVGYVLRMARWMDERNKRHPHIWLQCLRMDDTREELRTFAQRYGEGRIVKYQQLQGIKGGKVFFKLHESYASQVKPRGWGWDAASGRGRRFDCRKPFKRATILSDGGMTICCYDVLGQCVVGSLENNSIAGIWRGETMRQIRLGFDAAREQRKVQQWSDDRLFPELCRGC